MMMKPSIQKVRDFFFTSHDDEGGAVALLCLAAVIALMMMAWIIFDAHKSVGDKIMLQGAADTAAFSHAAVEARSMNMIAYGNIAKRSIVDIHAMYTGMYLAYVAWIAKRWSECNPPFRIWPCIDAAINSIMMGIETLSDQTNYSGSPIPPLILGRGLSRSAYLRDLQAIDNYQHYMLHVTPWWGFSEQLARGWRNGATTVVSFPPPPGRITVGLSAIQQAINTVNMFLSFFGMKTIDINAYHGNDNLPLVKTSYGGWDWMQQLIDVTGHPAFAVEHLVNAYIHKRNSSMGAASWFVFGLGLVLAGSAGFFNSANNFGVTGDPYELSTGGSQATWLKRTSNLAFAYLNDPTRMDEDRSKYELMSHEYSHTGGFLAGMMYETSGYWTMAKSEIVYMGGTPDMWHPSWTARMRPVHLPGEFAAANHSMFEAYAQVVPYLALTAQLGSIQGGNTLNAILSSLKDIVMLGFSTAAMGPTTASGIAK
jgi:hypothetical protein